MNIRLVSSPEADAIWDANMAAPHGLGWLDRTIRKLNRIAGVAEGTG